MLLPVLPFADRMLAGASALRIATSATTVDYAMQRDDRQAQRLVFERGTEVCMRIPTIARMYSDLMPRSVPI